MILIIAAGKTKRTGRNRRCESTRCHSPTYLFQNLCKAARRRRHGRTLFSVEKQLAFPFCNLLHPNRPEMSSQVANSSIRQVVLPPGESSSAGSQEHAEGGDDTKMIRVLYAKLVSLSTRCHCTAQTLPACATDAFADLSWTVSSLSI
jgi:hypothetical protein